MRFPFCIALISLIGLMGCPFSFDPPATDDADEDARVRIEVTSDLITLAPGEDLVIPFVYVNESTRSRFSGSCLGHTGRTLEKRIDGEWEFAYVPPCPDILQPPVEIGPGETMEADLRISSSTWDPAWPTPSWQGGDVEGTYRIPDKIYLGWSMEGYDSGTLASEPVVSNAFEVRLEE